VSSPWRFHHFYNPRAFLRAAHQHAAMIEECSMCDLKPFCMFQSFNENIDEKGRVLVVDGLFIQGATLQKSSNGLYELVPVNVNSPATAPTPPLVITYCTSAEAGKTTGLLASTASTFIDIPLYLSSSREQKLLDVKVMCAKNERSKWVLCGVALCIDES